MVDRADSKIPAADALIKCSLLYPPGGRAQYLEAGRLLDLTNPEHEEVYHQNGLTAVIRSIAGEQHPLILSVTVAQLDPDGCEENSIQFIPRDSELIRLKPAAGLLPEGAAVEPIALDVLREILTIGLASGGLLGRGQIEAAICANFEGFEERATIAELHIAERPIESIDAAGVMQALVAEPRDQRTGCYNREVIYQQDFMRSLRDRLGDEIEVYVMDYNHCRVANANGMRAIVDRIFAYHPGAIEAAFTKRGLPSVQVRLGGDEFLLLTKHDPRAIECVREGARGAENYARCWLYSHDEYTEAEAASRLRDAERNERHRFLELIGGKTKFSLVKWCHYYLLKLTERGLDGRKLEPEELALELARSNAEAPQSEPSLMNKTISNGVRVSLADGDEGSNLRALLRAIGQCDRSISARKLSAGPIEVQPLDPAIVDRQATLRAVARVADVAKRFTERLLRVRQAKLSGLDVNGLRASEETMQAFRERAVNPLINHDLQRYPHIRLRSAAEVLGLHQPKDFLAVRIDLNAYGKLNHTEGSDRADEIKAGIVELVSREFPAVFLGEEGGGGILALLPNPEDRSYAQRLSQLLLRLNQSMYYALNRQVFEAGRMEHQIDKALGKALALGAEFKTGGKYGKVSVETARLQIAPDATMEAVYTDFAEARRKRIAAVKPKKSDRADFLTVAEEILEVEQALKRRR